VALRVDDRMTPRAYARFTGTPTYMAPEQASTPEAAGPRADVFSAGLTMYVILTGRQPFPQHEAEDAYAEVDSIDERLGAIVRKACSPAPEDRYASAAEMADDLCAVGAELPEFRPETLHTPGTAPLRYLAPPSIPPMDDTWPPPELEPAMRERPKAQGDQRTTPDRYLEAESMDAVDVRAHMERPISLATVAMLVMLFVGASAGTWWVLNRVVPAIAAP